MEIRREMLKGHINRFCFQNSPSTEPLPHHVILEGHFDVAILVTVQAMT
jgi:hypothetical protein